MLDFIIKHYKKIIVVLLLIVVVWFANLIGFDEEHSWIERVLLDTFFRPAMETVNSIQNWGSGYWEVVMNYQEVKEENQRLKEELASRNYIEQQMTKIMKQNQRLRELANFKEYTPYEAVGSSVIGYSPDNWTSGIVINRGLEAGIDSNMPVVAQKGYLAGTVQKSSRHTAQVTLLNDPNFVIGGIVRREESRALGVVKGQEQEQDRLVMENVSWDADIEADDIIVTSGLSHHVPKGIPIGIVISVTPADYGLSQRVTLVPFAYLRRLEEVLVITDYTAKPEEMVPSSEIYPELEQEGR